MDSPTSDEKVLAALAHASVLFSFFGPIGPTIIWTLQRNKSRYVRFHALQAMGYQTFFLWAYFVGVFVVGFGGFFVLIFIGALLAERTSIGVELIPFIVQPAIFLGIFGLWGLFFAGGIVGAIFCMVDSNFRYPVIGRWVEQKIIAENVSTLESEEWEDNWVSGICHATTILRLWGIATPLIVWFSQKERSAKLRFQALQAAVHQTIAIVVSIVGVVAYMVFFFIIMFGAIASGTMSGAPSGELPPMVGIIFILSFAVLMVFWLLMMIGAPLYYLLAGVASILTVRGKNFRYPILGRIILRRIAVSGNVQGTSHS